MKLVLSWTCYKNLKLNALYTRTGMSNASSQQISGSISAVFVCKQSGDLLIKTRISRNNPSLIVCSFDSRLPDKHDASGECSNRKTTLTGQCRNWPQFLPVDESSIFRQGGTYTCGFGEITKANETAIWMRIGIDHKAVAMLRYFPEENSKSSPVHCWTHEEQRMKRRRSRT